MTSRIFVFGQWAGRLGVGAAQNVLHSLKPETPSTIMASPSTDGGSPRSCVIRSKTKALRVKVDFQFWTYKDQLLPACSPFQKPSGLTSEEPATLPGITPRWYLWEAVAPDCLLHISQARVWFQPQLW